MACDKLNAAAGVLAAARQEHGIHSEEAAAALLRVAKLHVAAGEPRTALPLLSEAMVSARRRQGEGGPEALAVMLVLSQAHGELEEFDKAIPLARQVLRMQRKELGPENVDALVCQGDLAVLHGAAGEPTVALPLLQECVTSLRKVLGDADPLTQLYMRHCKAQYMIVHQAPSKPEPEPQLPEPEPEPASPSVIVTVVGLVGASELNGLPAAVESWDDAKGRYSCRVFTDGPHPGAGAAANSHAASPSAAAKRARVVGIKPTNAVMAEGTPVCIVALQAVEMNGQRGTVREWVAESGRYKVAIDGRKKPVGLRPDNLRIQLV